MRTSPKTSSKLVRWENFACYECYVQSFFKAFLAFFYPDFAARGRLVAHLACLDQITAHTAQYHGSREPMFNADLIGLIGNPEWTSQ